MPSESAAIERGKRTWKSFFLRSDVRETSQALRKRSDLLTVQSVPSPSTSTLLASVSGRWVWVAERRS